MAHSLSSAGGFCAGSKEVVDHQRLSGVSYCFSAALPAMLAVAAVEGLKELQQSPQCLSTLRANVKAFRGILYNSRDIRLDADQESPLQHVRINRNLTDRQLLERQLQTVVDELRADGILLTRAKYVASQEVKAPIPSIRVLISAAHSKQELESAAKRIKKALEKLLK
jgi:serine palmitoyltransferase